MVLSVELGSIGFWYYDDRTRPWAVEGLGDSFHQHAVYLLLYSLTAGLRDSVGP